MPKKELTIVEIAKMAGVSTSTVSRVLNKQDHVNPVKRQKVQEILDRSGFQPSATARAMVSKRTNTFGVVVSDINNPYFTTLVSQIEAAAKDAGYSLLLFNTQTAGGLQQSTITTVEIEAFHRLEEKKVDGVLILGGEIDRADPDADYLDTLHQLAQHLPVVIVAQPLKDSGFNFVARYQKLAATTITQHLLACGYHDIAFIGGEPGITITNERLAGYREIMDTYSTFREDRVFLSDYYAQSGFDSMTELINQNDLPKAVVAINDQVALGAIRALNDHGLKCPEDIAIASCDAFPNSTFFTPRITTIDHHNTRLAQIAVAKLLNAISPKRYPLGDLSIEPPSLLIRESSGLKGTKS